MRLLCLAVLALMMIGIMYASEPDCTDAHLAIAPKANCAPGRGWWPRGQITAQRRLSINAQCPLAYFAQQAACIKNLMGSYLQTLDLVPTV